jgi:hypothetical protein
MQSYFKLLFIELTHMLTYDFLRNNAIPLNLSEQLLFFQRADVRDRMNCIISQIHTFDYDPSRSNRYLFEHVLEDEILVGIIRQYEDMAEYIRDEDISSYQVRILKFNERIYDVEPMLIDNSR